MSDKQDSAQPPTDVVALRQRAEAQVRNMASPAPAAHTPEEIQQMLHELRVHQIELEMQNEELRRAHEAERARYFDLYDLAPAGYCTVSENGLILEANLTLATLLSTARRALIKQPLSHFIIKEDQDRYYLQRKQLFETGTAQECDLRLIKPDGTGFWAHLVATAARAEDGAHLCRVVIIDITERKRHENELRIARELSERMIEDGPVAITLVNRNGKIVLANRHAEQILGLEKPTIKTLSYNDPKWLISAVDGSSFPEEHLPFCRVMATGQAVYDIEHAITPPDGARKILSINAAPLHDEQGRIDRVVCSIQDITELRQAEEHLQKFKQIVSSTSEGIALLDKNYCYLITNKAYETFSGKKQEEFIGLSVADYLGEAVFLEHVRPQFDRCLKGETISYQDCFEYPTLGKRFVEVTYFPYIDVKGEIAGVVANTRDITERKQAEEKLQQSKDMICLLLDSTAEAIYGVDLQGVCTFCNAACVRILGYDSADQIIGRNIHDLIHHSHADGTPLPVRDCVLLKDLDRQIHCDNEKFWHADGSSFPVEYWSYPIRQDNHKNLGLVVSFVDITERKQAEQQLKQRKTQLEQRNRALRQFNYAVSHELKTPLVSIESSLGLIQSSLPQTMNPELTTVFGYARTATRQMNSLLESLLLMFRIDAADTDTEVTAFRVLVQDAVDQLTKGCKLEGIKVTIAAEGPELCGDRHKLILIWLHLIGNAAKYMGDQKHPEIAVGVEQTGLEVLFFVRDNGMGIEEQHQVNIFEFFDRLNKASVGTGMGLTLVKRIVDFYGGAIRVESDGLGKGSCFYFTLPDVLINKDKTT